MEEPEAGIVYYSGPQTGARHEGTLRCEGGAGAYFRIRVMVSFRSFPWKGREPVSISNCRRQGSIQALVPSSQAPTSSPPGHSAPFPGFLLAYRRFTWTRELRLSLSPLLVRTPGAVLGVIRERPSPRLGAPPVETSLESFQGRKLQLGGR